jgi:ribonuclease HI
LGPVFQGVTFLSTPKYPHRPLCGCISSQQRKKREISSAKWAFLVTSPAEIEKEEFVCWERKKEKKETYSLGHAGEFSCTKSELILSALHAGLHTEKHGFSTSAHQQRLPSLSRAVVESSKKKKKKIERKRKKNMSTNKKEKAKEENLLKSFFDISEFYVCELVLELPQLGVDCDLG